MIAIGGRRARVRGDVGCPETYSEPVLFETAAGTSMQQVFDGRERDMLSSLEQAGQTLVERGATVLTTTCGLLTTLQPELAARFDVPVAVSPLLQVPGLLETIAPRKIGVVTVLADLLTPGRLAAAGIAPERVEVLDLSGARHFVPALREGLAIDPQLAEREICECVHAASPEVGALVVECANLPPYSAALRAATGLPVWDALDQIRWLAPASR
ncbi:hypothetical protein SSMG_02990 [Streptomyces sp. AA4]|uniref:hypothetical protein n=1 Tax=Amycolatopsis sp. AA4 TaxID=1896961 RepID=UPI0001B55ACC|nr:hypothetical protein [Amycolatopsis sp. AA4]EFL07319.1 hypothetical protein SSMG_02990 [Streptomyces sp. AA4]